MSPDGASAASAAISAEQPWPGLLPFTEAARGFFHGRDDEATELLRSIKRGTLSVLFGQSGLGKSSLLRAGLFPKLRLEGYLPIYIRLQLSAGAAPPGQQLRDCIAAECLAHQVEAPAAVPQRTLWEYFHRRDADFWSARNQLLTPVLVFDQFEELFTLGHGVNAVDQRCALFLDELADLVEHRIPAALAAAGGGEAALPQDLDAARNNFRVLLSFREDYLAEFEGLRARMPSIMRNRVRLMRMDADHAEAAIIRSGGHLVSAAVAQQIIRFVSAPRGGARRSEAGQAGLEVEPALLSVVCRELNNRRLALRRQHIGAELLAGSAQQQIINDFYEASFQGIDPRLRDFIEDQLLTEAGFRDSFAHDDALRQPGVLRAEVDRLIERRLLRLEERAGVLRLELTHDLLTDVARESRDRRQRTAAEHARQAQDERRRRRWRRLLALGTAAGLSALGLSVLFAVLLRQANEDKRHLRQTQSEVLLGRANGLFELGVAGEPQHKLAQALQQDADNGSAVARAMAYLSQRSFARRVAELSLPAGQQAGLVEVEWSEPGRFAVVSATGRQDFTVPPAVAGDTQAAGPAEAAGLLQLQRLQRLPLPDASLAWPAGAAPAGVGERLTVWLEGGQQLRVAPRGGGAAQGIAVAGGRAPLVLSADGQRVMLRNGAGSVLVFGLSPGAPPLLLHSVAAAQGSTRFGPAGRRLLARDGDLVTLYDLDRDRLQRLAHPQPVNAVQVSADGERVATACQDQHARLWDTASGALLGAPLRHEGSVLSVDFSADGRHLLTGSLDGTARLWSTRGGPALLEPLLTGHEVRLARFAPDGRHALVLSADGRASFWRLQDPDPSASAWPLSAALAAAAFDQPSARLAVATADSRLSLWQMSAQAAAPSRLRPLWSQTTAAPVTQLAVAPGGGPVAAALANHAVQLFDARTGAALGPGLQHPAEVLSLRFSADGRLLATGAADGSARVYDVATQRIHGFPMQRPGEAVRSVEFSPDRRYLLTAGLLQQRTRVWLWPLDTRLPVPVLEGEHLALAGFTGGAGFVTVLDRSVQQWRWQAGAQAGDAPRVVATQAPLTLGHLIWSAALSADGRQLAVGGLNGVTRSIDLLRWQAMGEAMKGVGVVESVAYSRDGRWLLTRHAGQVARVWDGRSGIAVADPLTGDGALAAAWLGAEAGHALLVEQGGQLGLRRLGLDFDLPAPAWLPPLVLLAGGGGLDAAGAMVWAGDRDPQLAALGNAEAGPSRAWQDRLQSLLIRLGASPAPQRHTP